MVLSYSSISRIEANKWFQNVQCYTRRMGSENTSVTYYCLNGLLIHLIFISDLLPVASESTFLPWTLQPDATGFSQSERRVRREHDLHRPLHQVRQHAAGLCLLDEQSWVHDKRSEECSLVHGRWSVRVIVQKMFLII